MALNTSILAAMNLNQMVVMLNVNFFTQRKSVKENDMIYI